MISYHLKVEYTIERMRAYDGSLVQLKGTILRSQEG